MRKSVDYRIGVVVARAAIPAGETGIGAQLHKAKGCGGAGVGVAVAAGANKGVDQGGWTLRLSMNKCGGNNGYIYQQVS